MASSAVSWGIRTVDAYQKLEQVGEGTYGHVFKGVEKKTGEQVALKRLIFHASKEPAGMPQYAIREIKALKQLAHKNIVKLKDVVVSFDEEDNAKEEEDNELRRCGQLYLVFEYVDHDLAGLLDNRYEFSPQAIKTIMKQLFEVLDFLHSRQLIHRDIKCSNLLLSNNYVLKLADFGLSRTLNAGYDDSFLRPGQRKPAAKMTYNVITLWYRPPELLLGCRDYDYAVDMWSAGCILGELLARRPLFPAKTEVQQLDTIFQRVGTPTKSSWPEYDTLPNPYNYSFQPVYQQDFASLFPYPIPQSAMDLVQRLLVPDPKMRYTCQKAIEHRYFAEEPRAPSSPEELGTLNLTPGSSLHEYQTKKAKRAAKAAQDGGGGDAQLNSDMQFSQAPESAVPSWFPPPPPPLSQVPPMPPPLPPNVPMAAAGYPPLPQSVVAQTFQAGYQAPQFNPHATYHHHHPQHAPGAQFVAGGETDRVRQHMMFTDAARAALSVNYQHVSVAPPPPMPDYGYAAAPMAGHYGPAAGYGQLQYQDYDQSSRYGNGTAHRSRSRSFEVELGSDSDRREPTTRHPQDESARWAQSDGYADRGGRPRDRSADSRATYDARDGGRDGRDVRDGRFSRDSREFRWSEDRPQDGRRGAAERGAQVASWYGSRDADEKRNGQHSASRSDSRGRQSRRSRSRTRSRSRSRGHGDSFSHRRSQGRGYSHDDRSGYSHRGDSYDKDRSWHSSSSRR